MDNILPTLEYMIWKKRGLKPEEEHKEEPSQAGGDILTETDGTTQTMINLCCPMAKRLEVP